MTEEEIAKKAAEAFPNDGITSTEELRDIDMSRMGYIKALEEMSSVRKIPGWVARDEIEDPIYGMGLCLHYKKPRRTANEWSGKTIMMHLPSDMFPEVTWVSEPKEVEVLIKSKDD